MALRVNRSGRDLRRERRDERGVVLIMVAFLLVVLIGFAALVVDIGNLYRVRGELQNAADSAALAGAQELDRTAAGLGRARVAVQQYASKNLANQTQVNISNNDIIFGSWDPSTELFTSLGPNPLNPGAVNAVKVLDHRSAVQGNPVALYLARVFGDTQANVDTAATAVGGGPSSECGFPMVVPDCSLDSTIAAGTCDFCMVYQDNNTDNAGWTSFGSGSVGGPAITDLIHSACYDSDGNVAIDPKTGECDGSCDTTSAGQQVKVQNGNLMNTGKNNFCPLIEDILRRGNPTGPAIPFVVKVPVLQSTSGTCDADQFSGFHTVAGYAAMEIYGAKCGKSDPGVLAAPPSGLSCTPPPSDKYVVAALRCDLDSTDGVAGGGFFGLQALHVRLVQ